MDILVLYKCFFRKDRRTISDHLYSFSRYVDGCRFVYLDVGSLCWFPRSIERYPFDAVIYHYTFLAERFERDRFWHLYRKLKKRFQRLHGVKVMIPHDEYGYTDALWRIARECDISRIYCSCYPEDYATIFPPEQVGERVVCRTVLTGYVDDGLVEMVQNELSQQPRPLDIGYRALDSNYIFGKHGYLKAQLAKEVLSALPRHPELVTDIKMTGNNANKMLVGDDWIRFLLSCRTTIGCLGGSSLFDPDGQLSVTVKAYLSKHPDASYSEVAAACYPGLDNILKSRLLGPKHLECAITRTCQLLVEGDYHGVLEAGRDYIEIKQDFSNIDEVLDRITDKAYCESIAQQCYEHVVASGKYTYRVFANGIIDELRLLRQDLPDNAAGTDAQIEWLRRMAQIVHHANMLFDCCLNLVKKVIYRMTKNDPEVYQRLRAWYKRKRYGDQ